MASASGGWRKYRTAWDEWRPVWQVTRPSALGQRGGDDGPNALGTCIGAGEPAVPRSAEPEE